MKIKITADSNHDPVDTRDALLASLGINNVTVQTDKHAFVRRKSYVSGEVTEAQLKNMLHWIDENNDFLQYLRIIYHHEVKDFHESELVLLDIAPVQEPKELGRNMGKYFSCVNRCSSCGYCVWNPNGSIPYNKTEREVFKMSNLLFVKKELAKILFEPYSDNKIFNIPNSNYSYVYAGSGPELAPDEQFETSPEACDACGIFSVFREKAPRRGSVPVQDSVTTVIVAINDPVYVREYQSENNNSGLYFARQTFGDASLHNFNPLVNRPLIMKKKIYSSLVQAAPNANFESYARPVRVTKQRVHHEIS